MDAFAGMLGFAESILGWLAITAVPALVGLAIVGGMSRFLNTKYLVTFAFGIFLWFFVDTISESAYLYVSLGFGGGLDQLAVLVLFVIGVVAFISADGSVFSEGVVKGVDLRVPMLVAVAIGVHGLGEGTAFGYTAANTSYADLLDAFGGVSAGVSYALHKALEPMIIGACYIAYRTRAAGATWMKDTGLLAFLFVVPSLIGAATGYFVRYDATYFFALGTGTSAYAAVRLVKPMFAGPVGETKGESLKLGFWLVLGLVCIYVSALFHE